MVSEDTKNLREVEDAGRITVAHHRSQAVHIEEGFLLDRRDSYGNRCYFEKNKKTINENDMRKKQRYNNLGIVVERERI